MMNNRSVFTLLVVIAAVPLLFFQNCSGVTVGNPIDMPSDGENLIDMPVMQPSTESGQIIFSTFNSNIQPGINLESINLCIDKIILTDTVNALGAPIQHNPPLNIEIDSGSGFTLNSIVDSNIAPSIAIFYITPACGDDNYSATVLVNSILSTTNESRSIELPLQSQSNQDNSGVNYLINTQTLITEVLLLIAD